MDVTWFPFDSQSCNIQFGSWSYSGQEIDFNLVNVTGLAFDLSEYVTNGEWKLVEFTGRRMEKFYGCCEEAYITIVFTIKIKRQVLYHCFNLVVPAALIGE